MEEGAIKKLLATVRCSVCGRHYEPGDIDIIGRRRHMWYLKAVCSVCNSQALMAASFKETAETVTDLTESEKKKFRDAEVTSDDMLDMHIFLNDFSGSVRELLPYK